MKKLLKVLGVIVGLILLVVIGVALLTPWMDRWGATDEEIAAYYGLDPTTLLTAIAPANADNPTISPFTISIGIANTMVLLWS